MFTNNIQPKPPSRRLTYKKTFIEWCRKSTSHGLPNVFLTHNIFIRVMWLFFFLLATGYCVYVILTSIVEYTKYDTNTNIEIVRSKNTEFPAVTICNLNPYSYSNRSAKFISSILAANNISDRAGLDFSQAAKADNPFQLLENFFVKVNRIIASATVNDPSTRFPLGFDLQKDMLLSCTYNKLPCNASDFYYFWSNEYGNCYTFNSGKNANNDDVELLKTSRSGQDYGLKLEILTGNPANYTWLSYRKGIFLAVHNSSTPPELVTEGITVSSGYDTYVPIGRTFYSREGPPYSNCIDSMDDFAKVNDYSKALYGYIQNLNLSSYSQDLCYKMCFQDNLVSKCNCSEINIPRINDTLYCRTNDELDCLAQVNDDFSQSSIDDLCQNACPLQCNDVKYDISDHIALYPTDYYAEQVLSAAHMVSSTNDPYSVLKQSYDMLISLKYNSVAILQFIRENALKVTVNYNELEYTSIEENPAMTFSTLLGVLGGELNLFIGISMLSLVEILELLVELFFVYRKNRKIAQG